MKRRIIEVTDEDIMCARGERSRHVGNSLCCPIAQALKRSFGAHSVQVDYADAQIYFPDGFPLNVATTEPMRCFMRQYDAYCEAEPAKFRVEWEA